MTTAQTERFREVLSNREARALLLAQLVSEIGDQVARVAVAYFVVDQTDSLLYGALTLAIAYVPGIFGTAFLGTLADRMPRRALMLWCDLIRVFLVVLMAFVISSGFPLVFVFMLLLVGETVAAPFGIARSALWPDVVPQRDLFVAAHALSRALFLSAQVVGFVVGGLLTQVIGVELALLLDAFTFGFSYVILRSQVSSRPVAAEAGTSASRMLGDVAAGWREVMGDRNRRWLVMFGWVSAFFLIAPEAVALGWRADLNAAMAGVLLATVPAGAAVGFLLIPRLTLPRQTELIVPLAALSCLPLFASSINPPPVTAAALWFIAGVLQAWVLTLMAATTALTEPALRGRVLGVASAGFSAATALSFAVVGALGDAIGPARAVSLAGLLGLLAVGVFWRSAPGAELIDAVAEAEVLSPVDEPMTDLLETVIPVAPEEAPSVDLAAAMAGYLRSPDVVAAAAPPAFRTEPVAGVPAHGLSMRPPSTAAPNYEVPLAEPMSVSGNEPLAEPTAWNEPASGQAMLEPDLRFAETASLVVEHQGESTPATTNDDLVVVQPEPEPEPEPVREWPTEAEPATDILPGKPVDAPLWPAGDADSTQPVPRID